MDIRFGLFRVVITQKGAAKERGFMVRLRLTVRLTSTVYRLGALRLGFGSSDGEGSSHLQVRGSV